MRSIVLCLTAITLTLTACQGPMTNPQPSTPGAQAQVRPNYELCGELGFKKLDAQSPTQRVPHIAKENQFMGDFSYGSISVPGVVKGLMFSCPTSDPIAPIPTGYTPDWFGSWTLVCKKDQDCAGLTFGGSGLIGEITSNVWTASRTYYLYVYTLDARQLVESYQIGPISPGTKGNSILTFASPFENGLQYPTNQGFSLEIVHPSSE